MFKAMVRVLLFCLLIPSIVLAGDFPGVEALVNRRVKWLSSHIVFEKIKAEKDVYEISSSNNKVLIKASNANSAAVGLNRYLADFCHRSMSHMGDNLTPVNPLPLVKIPVKVESPFEYRYALNYCTHNYTMSFYTWKEWERELDWMALNGVNMMLAITGTEAVWQNTLRRLNFNEKEILDFIPGPGFNAWWLMGNLEGWGGPVSQTYIDQQSKLQLQILQRMKVLGIKPVMQGFYGMIPTSLKNIMKINVLEQGKWAGGFQRPDFLVTTDPSFAKIAGTYYEEMQKLYGKDIKFFGGDPFHEGGKTNGIDVSQSATTIQQQMLQYFPNSTWVLQGWQVNPKKELLSRLDKKHVMVQELFGENTNNWETRTGYEMTPFIWCSVNNFGEKVGLYGKLQRFANEVHRAENSSYRQLMKGIGIMPEGIHNNPVVYELMLNLGWQKDKVDVSEWIKGFTYSRYGKQNSHISTAWQELLQTVYSSFSIYQEGPSESIFCARPSLNVKTVSSWGTRKRNYDVNRFKLAVKEFAKAAPDFKNSETYQTDLIDFVRQVLANQGDTVYKRIIIAYQSKNIENFKQATAEFLQLITTQEALLGTNDHFNLEWWLQQAYNMGQTSADRALFVLNAKQQITYWGPDNPETDLHEYAHKEWAGMLASFYLPRWKLYFDYLEKDLKGENPQPVDFYAWEKEWTEQPFSPKKTESGDIMSIVKVALN
ncbi:alpha-N-acetylglucosaminidase [Solitalea lacus]|uniref:alpha-N-acetylglucosaminidase n=1 Tax=Solitalea lacus TaxID=2911172 RepID=UPI001EDB08CD|nr:alpha-N-acetylglucosaminidase [Solitalea lacus]UKJ08915.1 alpha-N-acetylglucosaminidase [Solitalea lacus]